MYVSESVHALLMTSVKTKAAGPPLPRSSAAVLSQCELQAEACTPRDRRAGGEGD